MAPERSAFTIVELAIVLAVLAVLSSVAIPAYFSRPEVTLDNAARLLARDLREVQNRAALYHERLYVRFDEEGDGYRVTDAVDQPLLSPHGRGPYVRVFSIDAVFRGVKIAHLDIGKGDAIEFSPSGVARAAAEIVLTYRDTSRIVRLRPFTGLIEIEGLGEPWLDTGF